jgi:rapamycin-insensitive companion of mTOR
MQHLEIDEWKPSNKSANSIKEFKLEKLDILIRILKNTTGIEAYYPKKKMILW